MLTLAQYLVAQKVGKSAFARRLGDRLGERVPPQSVHRWTLDKTHPDYSVPGRARVEAINVETEGLVAPASWYAEGVRRPRKARSAEVNLAAARKGAVTRRRQREARP